MFDNISLNRYIPFFLLHQLFSFHLEGLQELLVGFFLLLVLLHLFLQLLLEQGQLCIGNLRKKRDATDEDLLFR